MFFRSGCGKNSYIAAKNSYFGAKNSYFAGKNSYFAAKNSYFAARLGFEIKNQDLGFRKSGFQLFTKLSGLFPSFFLLVFACTYSDVLGFFFQTLVRG